VLFLCALIQTFADVSSYDGDLTISIDPGLDIRIPNHQLVVPDYDINDQGQEYIKNNSNREVLINSLQDVNANDMIVLGLPFFTSGTYFLRRDYNLNYMTPSKRETSPKAGQYTIRLSHILQEQS